MFCVQYIKMEKLTALITVLSRIRDPNLKGEPKQTDNTFYVRHAESSFQRVSPPPFSKISTLEIIVEAGAFSRQSIASEWASWYLIMSKGASFFGKLCTHQKSSIFHIRVLLAPKANGGTNIPASNKGSGLTRRRYRENGTLVWQERLFKR